MLVKQRLPLLIIYRQICHSYGWQIRKQPVSQMNRDLLARCYRSLALADEKG